MTAPLFTPGPWIANGSHVYAPDLAIIATVSNPGARASDYPLVENANLISAAPWLYDACEDALEALALLRIALIHDRHAITMIDTHIDEIKTALSKARGEQ